MLTFVLTSLIFGGVISKIIYQSFDKYNDTRLNPLALSTTKKINSEKQYNLVLLGDSHAQYWKIDEKDILNLGITGQTSQQIKYRYDLIKNQIKGGESLILSIGANDIKSIATNPTEKEDIVNRCVTSIQYLIADNKDKFKNIYIITIPPDFDVSFPFQWIYYQETVDAKTMLNAKIRKLAEENQLILIDAYQVFKNKLGKEYSTDGVHMNEKAYYILNQSIK